MPGWGWRSLWDAERWRAYPLEGETEAERIAIRRCTHTGRPLGADEFITGLKQAIQRKLMPERAGRHPKASEASK